MTTTTYVHSAANRYWPAVFAAIGADLVFAAAMRAEPALRALPMPAVARTLVIAAAYAAPIVLATWSALSFYALLRRGSAPATFAAAINSGWPLPLLLFFGQAMPIAAAAGLTLCCNVAAALPPAVRGRQGARRWLAFTVALSAQWVAALFAMSNHLLAVIGVFVGLLALLLLLRSWDRSVPTRVSFPGTAAALAAAVVLAVWISLGTTAPVRAMDDVDRVLLSLRTMPQAVPEQPDRLENVSISPESGAILWPEVRQGATSLVAPLPVWSGLAGGRPIERDTSIPFAGEYWFFEAPARRPPPNFTVRRGTPLTVRFHTASQKPLGMEAHQKLPGPVAFTCCRGVSVEASTRDDAMVVLELLLGSGGRRVSLDQMPLLGSRVFFPFPKDVPLTHFDEIAVVVHRLPRPTGQSPKVAIQRFVLVR